VNNNIEIIEAIEDELGVKPDENTPDGKFTFMTVACLGCCSLAPVIMINDDTFGNLDRKQAAKIIKEYKNK
jgi:NADH-quinone oxidoreductase subunit E